MRFEDFRFMIKLINFKEEEILNAGLTPCSHTTTTKILRICLFFKRCILICTIYQISCAMFLCLYIDFVVGYL